jgi:hypothetical protein
MKPVNRKHLLINRLKVIKYLVTYNNLLFVKCKHAKRMHVYLFKFMHFCVVKEHYVDILDLAYNLHKHSKQTSFMHSKLH